MYGLRFDNIYVTNPIDRLHLIVFVRSIVDFNQSDFDLEKKADYISTKLLIIELVCFKYVLS